MHIKEVQLSVALNSAHTIVSAVLVIRFVHTASFICYKYQWYRYLGVSVDLWMREGRNCI